MIELIQIIAHFFLFIFLTSFPFNTLTTPKISKVFKDSYLNLIFINSLVLMFVFLLLSFFRLNLNYIFFTISSLYLIILLIISINIYKNKTKIIIKKDIFFKILFCIICLSLFFNTANNLEIGWDGLGIWIFKTNNFYNGQSYSDLFVNKVNYIQYPHLGSYIWAFFWKNSFLQFEYLGRLYYLYIYLISIFILSETLNIRSKLKKIIFILFILIFSYDYDNSMGGYQEILIFSLLIFAAKILEFIKSEKNEFNIIILSLFFMIDLILLSWIKNESLFYALFLILIYMTIFKLNFKVIIFFMLSILLITSQILIKKYFFDLDKTFLFSLSPESLTKNLNFTEFSERIFYTSVYIFHSILKYPISVINLISIIICFKYLKKSQDYKIYLYFFILNVLFLYSVYMVTDAPLIWHLKTSVERLILQTSGFYIFILIHLINKKLIKF